MILRPLRETLSLRNTRLSSLDGTMVQNFHKNGAVHAITTSSDMLAYLVLKKANLNHSDLGVMLRLSAMIVLSMAFSTSTGVLISVVSVVLLWCLFHVLTLFNCS